jgi:hypothetical protein
MKTQKTKLYQALKLAMFLASSLVYAAPDVAPAVTPKTETEKAPAAETLENLILSSLVADLNADKKMDSAILIKSGDRVDLYIFLGDGTGNMKLKLIKKDIVWSGSLAGTLPQLKSAKGGGFFIYSQNDAIGRNHWYHRLSVDYRDKEFIVTGFISDERDTLDPKFSLTCDVNLLTGNIVKNKAAFKNAAQKLKVSDWSDDKVPKQCRDK